jgi:hypothetical protein
MIIILEILKVVLSGIEDFEAGAATYFSSCQLQHARIGIERGFAARTLSNVKGHSARFSLGFRNW